ncbi:MAG: murein hydrolase activator EnvC [Rhizobiaceae bacterium]|nr:murein hydrolase activator EnvC [Rhizobiaceae bacterium]MCV0406040.1 murein hydrolase activator EnvC [Rhizobiaceae bacterium]
MRFLTVLIALMLAALEPAGIARAVAQTDEAALSERRDQSRAEYEQLRAQAALSKERLVELTAEVASIRKDNASLTAALIQTAKTEKKLAADIGEIEVRIGNLSDESDDIRLSLAERRGVLAEVLGALQRMGLDPPPAVLVTPDDALASVRSAILLGAVVPDLRDETRALVSDLDRLRHLTASLDAERGRLAGTVREQVAEKSRLTLLLAERRKLQEESEAQLKAEAERAEVLARQAESVQDLIASLEADLEEARKAKEERLRREAEAADRPAPEANRLSAAVPFGSLKGELSLPAEGGFVSRYGGEDGFGGTYHGDTVATQSGAIVTAPSDGTVLYAGPFRSYGQLLILNAGDGYHVVLAGLGRLDVSLGQPVLAGEPVGAMGEARLASASASPAGMSGPELYVEFRKDGKPVDPSPWWAERKPGRTGHGS